jgi:single-strand DNA-binding protein
MDLNRAQLIGHVGRDPTFHQMQNNEQLCKFSVATSRKWTKDGEKFEETQWHNIVIFNKYLVALAEKFVQKGTKLYLEGEIKTRTYEKDGEKKYITEITVPQVKGELIILAKGKGWTEESPSAPAAAAAAPHPDSSMDDDIPF